MCFYVYFFFFSSRRRHTRFDCDWSSDVCSSDLANWTFIIFGAIHGIVLPMERFFFPTKTKPSANAVPAPATGFFALWAQRIFTFNILCLSLAFFRATSLHAAAEFLAGLSNFAWRPEYASAIFMLCLYSRSEERRVG